MRAKSEDHTSDTRAWQAFHADNVRTYAAAWLGATRAKHLAIRRDEAAAGLLEHAALLWRYTADERIRSELRDWPPQRRRQLIRDACRYFVRTTYSAQMTTLCAHEALTDDHLARIQSLLLLRDGAQAALDVAVYLAQELWEKEPKLLFALADVYTQFAKGDEAILQRPDILSIAGKIFAPFQPLLRVELDKDRYWWIFHAAELDQQFTREEESGTLYQRLGLRRPLPRIMKLLPTRVVFDTRYIVMEQPLAAKTTEKTSFLVVTRKSVASLVGTARTRGRVASRSPVILPAARALPVPVVFGPRAVPEEPNRATAQWDASGLPRLPRTQALVLVADAKSGTLLGAGYFDPATKMITLVEGAWTAFEPYAHATEDLLLVLAS